MTKHRILFFIGIWVIVLPFLGFPVLIKTILFIATGIIIILISYKEYLIVKRSKDENNIMHSYIESRLD